MTVVPKDSNRVVHEHYNRLAKQYDEYLLYSPQFVRTLTSKMVQMLGLRENDRLVDLGCGTGMYSIDIAEQVPLTQKIIGVDPFGSMLAQIPPEAQIDPVEADALAFSREPRDYNKVFMKEAVHHITDRAELFANLYERLPSGGVLLLVHVPPRVQYPLFDKALRRCLNWHADPDELVTLLGAAGFRVERDGLDYPHELPREKYFEMVRGQYMSVLSSFTAQEIEAGLQEMQSRYAETPILRFTDHFDYIAGTKP